MTYNIIQTKNYLLIVNKKPITNWYYNETENKIDSVESTPTVIGGTVVHNIIAHLPLNGSPILTGVDLLPHLLDEAKEWVRSQWSCEPDDYEELYYDGLEKGYNSAKQKYKYTEEDLRKALSEAFMASYEGYQITSDEIIQSIQQPKMPVGFKCEISKRVDELYCMVVEEQKTTTNSQGKTVWLGKWIY